MNGKMKWLTTSILIMLLFAFWSVTQAETIQEWYANSQNRIDSLRKGNFGIKIYDKNGNPYSGKISVRMVKHEYPFGIAFDLYESSVNYGNSYQTNAGITAAYDAEIYQSERWYSFISYSIPVEKNKNYKVTLKFAEIYFNNSQSRIFDVIINGEKVMSNFDIFDAAGGKNIAIDSTFIINNSDSIINIEFVASKDNATIKGIEIATKEGDWIKRINCGGDALTTTDNHYYESDTAYFNKNASRVPTEEDWMKAVMPRYFNYGVSGNSFKWSGIQPQHTAPNYTNFNNAVRFAQSVGWELKAHTLLWGGYNYEDDHALPRWVKDLPTPKAIYDTCKMRVIREVSHYKGIIKEYDVMNEPLHATYLASVVGDSINWNCYKWARSADSTANLIVNDYNVEYNWGDARKYRDLINKMKSMGAPVTGVGMQAHFWQGMRPQLEELVANVNIVAEAGLPIKFTEFDNGILTEQEQAEDLVLVYTIAFSHPMMNGVISWALSDKGAWREKSGLFYENHKPKLAADTLLYLIKKKWATNFDTTLNGNSDLIFNAYYGTYQIEVPFGDTIKIFTIPCLKANKDSVFVLNESEAYIKGPEMLTAQLLNSNTLQISFDKEIKNESINNSDFKFFADNPLRIQNIYSDSINHKNLILVLDKPITPDDYLLVSYFPGTLQSIDGGKASAFGPINVKNLTTGLIGAFVIEDGAKIEAQFNANLLNLLDNLTSFTVTVNGSSTTISSIAYQLNDSSKAILTLSQPLVKNDKVTIKYTKGTLKPTAGFDCETSANITVKNIWPDIVNVEVSKTGKEIKVLFNTALINAIENKQAFTVKVNGEVIEITEMIQSGTDSTTLTLKLANTIAKGQQVTISYQPGNIKSILQNSLLAIENKTVKNSSIITGLELVNNTDVEVFPNPAAQSITIQSNNKAILIKVLNIESKILFESQLKTNTMTIDLSKWNPGIYFVKTINEKGYTNIQKIIKL